MKQAMVEMGSKTALVFDFKQKVLAKGFRGMMGSIKTWIVPSAPDCCKIELSMVVTYCTA